MKLKSSMKELNDVIVKLTFALKMRHYESNLNLPEPSFEILGNRQHLFLGFTSLGKDIDMTHSQMLGKFEYTRGPIFKVVLEC